MNEARFGPLSSLLTRQSQRFLKHSTHLQDNEKIELCGVARAFVQILKMDHGPKSLATPAIGGYT